jgi:hypothetical protein
MHEQQEDLGQQILVEVDDEVDVRENLIWPAFLEKRRIGNLILLLRSGLSLLDEVIFKAGALY